MAKKHKDRKYIQGLISKSVDEIYSTTKDNFLSSCGREITLAIEEILKCYAKKPRGKVILFGNGGSALDAQHMCCELIGRFKKEREGLPAIALNTDISVLTALSNDYSYDIVFCRQVQALINKNDVVIGISTSGNSSNVIRGVEEAKKIGAYTIGLTGDGGGKLKNVVDLCIRVPSNDTPRIQEMHTMVIHIICEVIEEILFN
jgi:D-sedoheptulose 7-phosphate isomerase